MQTKSSFTGTWRESVEFQREPEESVPDPELRREFGSEFPSGLVKWESCNLSSANIRVARKRREVRPLLQRLSLRRTILTKVGIWVACKIPRRVSREVARPLDLCIPISPETIVRLSRTIFSGTSFRF